MVSANEAYELLKDSTYHDTNTGKHFKFMSPDLNDPNRHGEVWEAAMLSLISDFLDKANDENIRQYMTKITFNYLGEEDLAIDFMKKVDKLLEQNAQKYPKIFDSNNPRPSLSQNIKEAEHALNLKQVKSKNSRQTMLLGLDSSLQKSQKAIELMKKRKAAKTQKESANNKENLPAPRSTKKP